MRTLQSFLVIPKLHLNWLFVTKTHVCILAAKKYWVHLLQHEIFVFYLLIICQCLKAGSCSLLVWCNVSWHRPKLSINGIIDTGMKLSVGMCILCVHVNKIQTKREPTHHNAAIPLRAVKNWYLKGFG